MHCLALPPGSELPPSQGVCEEMHAWVPPSPVSQGTASVENTNALLKKVSGTPL